LLLEAVRSTLTNSAVDSKLQLVLADVIPFQGLLQLFSDALDFWGDTL